MYRLSYERKFDAAHRLPRHPGKCKNLHGHTWRVQVLIKSLALNKDGMVVDFGVLRQIIDQLDHGLLNKTIANPTAENLADYLQTKVLGCMEPHQKASVKIRVWESELSMVEVA